MTETRILVLIPARMAATRLPGKPLLDIGGLPMIVHVLRRAEEAKIGRVAVATDTPEIAAAVEAHGGTVVMTRPEHPSGDPRPGVLVDLDDEIVEMILAGQSVAVISTIEPHSLIVMPVRWILAPAIRGGDRADRQKATRTWMAVGSPPQPDGAKRPTRRSAIAFAFVRLDSAAAERDGYGCVVGRQPSTESVSG